MTRLIHSRSSSPTKGVLFNDTDAVDGARFGPWPIVFVAALLGLAIIVGGGGVRHGIANLIVQLAALTVLAIRTPSAASFWWHAPMFLKLLLTLTVVLPLAQLIPLPESVWTTLPGRDLVQQSFALTGRSGWASASVDPIRTAVAMTGLIVPLAVLMAGWNLRKSQLVMLGWVIVGLGLANVLIGIPQVLSGGASAVLYSSPASTEILYGTFANRNSTGLLLVASLCLAVTLPSPRHHPAAIVVRVLIGFLLIVAVVLTRSRTALVLSAIPLALAGLRTISHWHSSRHFEVTMSRRGWLVMMGSFLIALGGIATVLTVAPGRVADTMERFQSQSDARAYIWEDSAYTVTRYWPAGSGMGTFDEVFQVDESLENATERRAGRAHNDYLEIAIEAGLPGLALVALWLVALGWFAWRARKSELSWAGWGAAAILLAIAMQSVTDYPMRNQAMLAVGSFALLLVSRIGTPSAENDQ